MSKSEYEYKITDISNNLTSPDPVAVISAYAEQGWDVQQVFTGYIPGQTEQTFALLRRKR
jgi:hypothetical protein